MLPKMALELRQEARRQNGNGFVTETAGMQSGPQLKRLRK